MPTKVLHCATAACFPGAMKFVASQGGDALDIRPTVA
jgi:organic hydroperoxide reductase OsmC/OhrA